MWIVFALILIVALIYLFLQGAGSEILKHDDSEKEFVSYLHGEGMSESEIMRMCEVLQCEYFPPVDVNISSSRDQSMRRKTHSESKQLNVRRKQS